MRRTLFGFLVLCISVCGACAPGETCGRGRCLEGECTAILERAAPDDIAVDFQYMPMVDNAMWCRRPCGGEAGCSGTCFEDPVDSNTVLCEGGIVDVEYFSTGNSLGEDYRTVKVVTSFSVLSAVGGGIVLDCSIGEPCDGGTLAAGSFLPPIETHFEDGTSVTRYPGNSGAGPSGPGDPPQLQASLPAGGRLRVYVDLLYFVER